MTEDLKTESQVIELDPIAPPSDQDEFNFVLKSNRKIMQLKRKKPND